MDDIQFFNTVGFHTEQAVRRISAPSNINISMKKAFCERSIFCIFPGVEVFDFWDLLIVQFSH